MTAQIAERLLYQGKEVLMHTNPLGSYLELTGMDPGFMVPTTCLW